MQNTNCEGALEPQPRSWSVFCGAYTKMYGLVLAAHGGRFLSREVTRYKVMDSEKESSLLFEYR